MMEGGYEYAVEGAPSATAMQEMVEDLIDSKANVDERWDLNNGAFIEVQRISPQVWFVYSGFWTRSGFVCLP
jgi:hypothetical protein